MFQPNQEVPEGGNEYLIRFSHYDGRKTPLLLMGDLGITWEPARAWHTEQLGFILGNSVMDDISEMVRVATEYYGTLDVSPEVIEFCKDYNGKHPGE